MMGISYGGISQLFTAQTNPPSLAAISPLSVIDATQTTLYPGGILNTGFAVDWAKERVHDAQPASPDGGQPWAYKRIQEGDQTCKANQALHREAADLMAKIRANDHYVPDGRRPARRRSRSSTRSTCRRSWPASGRTSRPAATARRWPKHFTGTSRKWFTFTNGTHVDSLAPETFNRWYDFLQLYVAKQAPIANSALIQAAAPVIYQEAMGITGRDAAARPDPAAADLRAALAAFEQLPRSASCSTTARAARSRATRPRLRALVAELPDPGHHGPVLVPGDRAARSPTAPPAQAGADSFTWNAHARPLTNFTGDTAAGTGGLWTATPPYQWTQNPAGSAVSYVTDPAERRTRRSIGAGAVHVWVRSSTPNVDLQATISEVRPDGKETFVQSGWVRGNERKLDAAKSTPLEPVLSLRAADVSPMPPQPFVKVTIPLYYQGHAYRAGSRIRVTIAAPNGDQPIWSFGETEPSGTATSRSPARSEMPSQPGAAGGAGRERPDRAAALPGPAGRAVPRPTSRRRSGRRQPLAPLELGLGRLLELERPGLDARPRARRC